jgi:cell division protein FtsB
MTIAQQQEDSQMTAARQQREIQDLSARLNAQESQIRKVSDQVEMSKPAPRVVLNNQ